MNYVNFNRQEGLAFTTSVDANPNTIYFTSDTHEIIINGQSYGPDLLPLWNKVSEVEVVTSAALNHLNDVKQDKMDNGLETTSKSVVGAINELNAKLSGGGPGTNEGNYLPLSGGTMSGNITMSGESRLIFGDTSIYNNGDLFIDGALQLGETLVVDETVTANGFHHTVNNSNDYVLLAGGGTKLLSDIGPDLSNYLEKSGGIMTGTITFTNASMLKHNETNILQYNENDSSLCLGENTGGNTDTITLSANYVISPGNINASAFYETSDIRKKDIKSDLSIDKCYNLLNTCQTVIYSLKEQDQNQVGMIAQEIEEFFPEVVATDENGFKSLAYDRLVVIVFKMLKDMVQRLEKLENV